MKKNVHSTVTPDVVVDRLLERYLAGYDTETGVILDVLNLSDELAIQHAIEIMPGDLFETFREFVHQYTPQTRVFRGPGPKMQTVQMARRLLSKDNGAPQRRIASPSVTVKRRTKRRD